MEICGKCNVRIFRGSCDCPAPALTLEKLLEIVAEGTFEVDYGNPEGRVESYSIDSYAMGGYDSSGGFRHTLIEDLDPNLVQSISKLTEVYRRA